MSRNVMESKKKETPFQLFFLKNDETQNVEVVELNEIDFEEVKSHIEIGESVFITRKQKQKPNMNFIAYNIIKEPGTFFAAKRKEKQDGIEKHR